ncbi:MAG TPA: beta-ketoacyl synthase chain length factor [Ideonella sp.]|uniref:beta-ketoacyl synthase chain length factor n=1 Tax=Ideonella sp. TaxID=1929293 RepID=UPI002E35E28F|nr:beta-ketoacyl synthase chain length factor [Ideonella sp.]HEX5686904.1 beta-ketoacyl synthase chain length factor [Ideonella sp.]
MNIDFVICDWAAWAPTLAERERWLAWAASADAPLPPATDDAPALTAMPAMARRRLNPLGRAAAEVAYQLADPAPGADSVAGTPMIYASRYGDAGRSLALLADLARGEPISPTAFGLSVHNAIGAAVSIARGDRAHHSALAGGASSAGAALVEAAGLLADGEDAVVIVQYDAPLPGDYASFADEPIAPYAWAWRVASPRAGQPHLRLQLGPAEPLPADATETDLPFGLALLRFALSGQATWARNADGQSWRWSRHG